MTSGGAMTSTGTVPSAGMRLDVVTIFPDYLAPLHQSLVGKAIERGQIELGVHDLRRWTDDVHRTVDDTPYGGGPGMVMRPEPWGRALDDLAPPAGPHQPRLVVPPPCLLYTSDAADEEDSVDLGGRRIIKN